MTEANGKEAVAEGRRATSSWISAVAIGAVAFLIYWLANRNYDAGRGDLFYLADAFLHGRTDIARQLGPWDVILIGGRVYVPFPPFPAIALMPLVAMTGPIVADQWESGINALIAASCGVLAWRLMPALGVARRQDKLRLFLLLAFSTPLLWVTTRGGVWHTGHLVATVLVLLTLHETWGRQRAWVIGLLLGAAFLTRPPIAFVAPIFAIWWAWPNTTEPGSSLEERIRALPWRRWGELGLGFVPALVFFFGYNAARFGSPTESGYALAELPDWLAALRTEGLFSLVHVPMNLDYLFVHLPMPISTFPFFKPDGLGMSIFLTSPGLVPFVLAPWRKDRRTWLLLGSAIAALVPTLLYYGGGWLQYGYRYFLDSIPFLWALCVLAAAHRGRVGRIWWAAIVIGVLINALGVYWAYNL